ncbi:methylmalonyl Co-A mutase-associated GTPase MeaB [Halobacteriales archaeon SW_7_68_16]|nr:MAG: methylmalonyl Co-A mutase-associated GTPase MeaB [Halobacteriales archaeon SW_7_68_16]
MTDVTDLAARVVDGEHRALARAISVVEDRREGYRDLVSRLHDHAGDARAIGLTGAPGSGKSTLVDKLAAEYRERGHTVGVIAIDPSSPFTGGAVLGDRIRMASNVGDMDVFVRSMSARGNLGGLSAATTDAITALDAFGKDRILIETVGAGQNEVDVVRAADTIAVLVPPGAGDNVQMLKAGILEIGDVFVVNKADLEGADRTVQELREMIELNRGKPAPTVGHHGPEHLRMEEAADGDDDTDWTPEIVETVATRGEGIDDFIRTVDDHHEFMLSSGHLAEKRRLRRAEEVRTLLREDVNGLIEAELERHGGLDALVDDVLAGDADPYGVADRVLAPLVDRLTREEADPGEPTADD